MVTALECERKERHMLDLTGVRTSGPAKYDFSRIEVTSLVGPAGTLITHALQHKQIMYDWGHGHFWGCKVPFVVDYEEKTILQAGTEEPVADDQWIGCDSRALHEALAHVFIGEWGPTSADDVARMESSGIRVELCGTTNFGPSDPKEFLDNLRREFHL